MKPGRRPSWSLPVRRAPTTRQKAVVQEHLCVQMTRLSEKLSSSRFTRTFTTALTLRRSTAKRSKTIWSAAAQASYLFSCCKQAIDCEMQEDGSVLLLDERIARLRDSQALPCSTHGYLDAVRYTLEELDRQLLPALSRCGRRVDRAKRRVPAPPTRRSSRFRSPAPSQWAYVFSAGRTPASRKHGAVGYTATYRRSATSGHRGSRRSCALPLRQHVVTAACHRMHYSPASATFLPTISSTRYAHQPTIDKTGNRSTATGSRP